MIIRIQPLSADDGQDILDMLHEIGPGENGFGNDAHDLDFDGFQAYLTKHVNMSQGIGFDPACFVPQTILWLFVDQRPVGMAKLRHFLNDRLLVHGGHIGYCIRPSERSKGYGTLLLSETLKHATKLGIDGALITCSEDNIASRRVVEANGGVLEAVIDSNCKYWIYGLLAR